MAQVFIAKPGVLRDIDKTALRKAGIVVVEADPADVRFMQAETEVPSGILLKAAIKSLASVDGQTATEQRETFAKLVAAALT